MDTTETESPSFAQSGKGLIMQLWSVIKVLPKYFVIINQRWNEAWLVVLGFLAWKYADVVMGYIDPTAPPLPVNDLMRFLYATIGTCIAHFVVTIMLRLSHPLIFKYLYGWFYADVFGDQTPNLKSTSLNHDLKCIRLKYSFLVWLLYLATWLVLVATY